MIDDQRLRDFSRHTEAAYVCAVAMRFPKLGRPNCPARSSKRRHSGELMVRFPPVSHRL
jgi:hypothetical protein